VVVGDDGRVLKTCLGCNETKAINEFCRAKAGVLGRNSRCRTCRKKAASAYYAKNKPALQAAAKRPEHKWLSLVHSAKAKKRGRDIPILLTKEQYLLLMAGAKCAYCGVLVNGVGGSSLDRKDPRGPYSVDNVVPCCGACNRTKMGLEQRYGDLAYEKMLAISALLREKTA
jgi:hypothetical protein